MQKLSEKLKNAPESASLALCSANSELNREETLSVRSSRETDRRTDNNPEVNQSQHTERSLKPLVYVISKEGKPLMPCSPAKASRMLKKGSVKVIKRFPFIIQLNFECNNQTLPITCGIDLGYQNIGFSCISDKKELIAGTMLLENKMSERLTERVMYRKLKRSKLWYREPRFNNRAKPEGWLAPSIQRRLNTHVELIRRLQRILPISKVVIEVANFDIQRINNPEISSKEYQQGELFGYENVKSYLLHRESGKCQLCSKEYDKNGWHLHHIKPKSLGGTDRPANLALLHEKCHKKLHKQNLYDKLKKAKQFKAEIFMSIIRWKIVEEVRKICSKVNVTYGYITKLNRIKLELEKSHVNDAFVIANGKDQERSIEYTLIQKKRNNRCLQLNRNGYKPSIRKVRYKIQSGDLFWINGKQYISKGILGYGRYILYGKGKKEYFKLQLVEKYFNINSWSFIL